MAGEARLRFSKRADGSLSWSVSIGAGGGSLTELRVAAQAAVLLSKELEAQVVGPAEGRSSEDEP
jgi:hypothetical protein